MYIWGYFYVMSFCYIVSIIPLLHSIILFLTIITVDCNFTILQLLWRTHFLRLRD